MKYRPTTVTAALLVGAMGLPVLGQSRQDKVDALTAVLSDTIEDESRVEYTAAGDSAVRGAATPRQLLDATTMNVDIRDTPARLALEIWSQQTQIPLIVNWAALENAGFDLNQPLNLTLRRVPAEFALKLLINQMNAEAFEDDRLLMEVNDYFVRIMTRDEALRRSVTRMYFIGDLLMDIPDFRGPNFDINQSLSNTSSGGSNSTGGGGGQGLFDEDDDFDDAPQKTATDKADEIADLIRETIEPDIWRANGGDYASIRYIRGMLVVRAPQFVHDQIGIPANEPATRRSTSRDRADRRSDRSDVRQPSRISTTREPVRTVK
ncbi:MAG: hypothetical protein AAGC44_02305 [Planctomycetota bacterium]